MVCQVVVWGKFGQCLINLKTNYRHRVWLIIGPLTPLFQECVLSTPLSTSSLCLTSSLRKSVEIFLGNCCSPGFWVFLDKLPSCSSPSRQEIKNKSTQIALLMSTLKNNLEEHPSRSLCLFYVDVSGCCCCCCCHEHTLNYKAFQEISKRIWYSQEDVFRFYESCWSLVMRILLVRNEISFGSFLYLNKTQNKQAVSYCSVTEQ